MIRVLVKGDSACFTRAEFSTERESYPVMTASSARAIMESIYWHTGFRYVIDRIRVCAPIRFTTIRQNELGAVANSNTILSAIKRGAYSEIGLSRNKNIQQRTTRLLKDVMYVIECHMELIPEDMNPSDNINKFLGIVTRRVEKGSCYKQPYLGIREYTAFFEPCQKIPPCPEELRGIKDLGYMLLDMDYSDIKNIKPIYFHAIMVDGMIELPDPKLAAGGAVYV